jgi:hypothetical protein
MQTMEKVPIIGIVYKAVDLATGKVIKVGSTIKSLKDRSRDKCYKGCVLSLIRQDEYEDSNYGVLLLRIRETLEISKNKTWHRDGCGGRNILNPINVWLSKLDDFEMRSYAGTKGGSKAFELHGNPATAEGSSKGGQVAGLNNVESGWAKILGDTYGHARGKKEVENGHLASLRTTEHQSYAGRKGGVRAAEVNAKTGWLQKLGNTYGLENIRKTPYAVKMKGLAMGRHVRWHVNRSKPNADCPLCKS